MKPTIKTALATFSVALVVALTLASCASNNDNGTSGSGGTTGSGGSTSSGGSTGSGGQASGGTTGSGGSGSGGTTGSGGSTSSGGTTGSGGSSSGGTTGSGGASSGGTTGSGGAAGAGETGGAGGHPAGGAGGGAGAAGHPGGGSNGSGGAAGSGSGGGSSGSFSVTSMHLTDGAHFDSKYTCQESPPLSGKSVGGLGNGVNPDLEWTGVPSGTMSFAITFLDTTLIDAKMDSLGNHWAMWNIPATVMTLPEATTSLSGTLANAKQSGTFLAPCAQSLMGGVDDQYAFTVYALATASLSVTGGTGVAQARTALSNAIAAGQVLGMAVLHGHAGLMGK